MHVSSARSFSLNPQDIVAEHRGKWAKIWLKFAGRCRTPWRDTGNLETAFSWMPTKRKFTAKDVLQGGLCFKDRTGRGVCDFHPRWFAYLPESSRQEFAELLNQLETLGIWPEQLMNTFIKLIPKPKGGKRPIGLLAALVRLWERMRIPEVRRWKQTAFRDYNWAAKGQDLHKMRCGAKAC